MFDSIGKIYVVQESFTNYGKTFPLLMKVTKVYFCSEWECLVREGIDNIGFQSKSRINNINEMPYRLATPEEILIFWKE